MTDAARDILRLIDRQQRFIITTHHNPDADAIAAALSMAIFLKAKGKTVRVLNEDPVPHWLSFLPRANLFEQASAVTKINYDAAIVVDCGDFNRVGGVRQLLDPKKPVVNIDHHITNSRFGDLNWVTAEVSSTCEIIFDLLAAARFRINKALAVLLYAGIMTDTGSFRYENTTSRTHAIAAALMTYGIGAQDLHDRLYVGIPVSDMQHFIDVIHRAKLYLNNRVYCVSLTRAAAVAFSKSFDLKDKLFIFLRGIKGIEVAVILTELSAKEVRVNFRSQSDFDVAKLALGFHGGGHTKAAGGKFFGPIAEAERKILAAIRKQLGSRAI